MRRKKKRKGGQDKGSALIANGMIMERDPVGVQLVKRLQVDTMTPLVLFPKRSSPLSSRPEIMPKGIKSSETCR